MIKVLTLLSIARRNGLNAERILFRLGTVLSNTTLIGKTSNSSLVYLQYCSKINPIGDGLNIYTRIGFANALEGGARQTIYNLMH